MENRIAGNGNANDNVNANVNNNANNVIFTIKDTKLYISVGTLSGRANIKLLKLLSKGFGGSHHWNEWKTKSEYKNKTIE